MRANDALSPANLSPVSSINAAITWKRIAGLFFVSFFPFTKVNQQVMTMHAHAKYISLQ
jgi:hypothetical protein